MEQKKVTGISKYLPAFGVKGWGIALMAFGLFMFQKNKDKFVLYL